jgi:hypothetical protein
MIKLERQMKWYGLTAIAAAPAWLIMGSKGFAPAAWLLAFALAWGIAWFYTKRYERLYRAALLRAADKIRDELPEGDDTQNLRDFLDLMRVETIKGAAIMKMNRWLGYVNGAMVTRGLSTVELERNRARGLFKALDEGLV